MQPKFILLMGIAGAGKTMICDRLAARYAGKIYVDSEQSAFDRKFVEGIDRSDPKLSADIVAHGLDIVRNFPPTSRIPIVVVDRWYETYMTSSGLTSDNARRIERAILDRGYKGHLVNCVIDETIEAIAARLQHTRANRSPSWWVTKRTFEDKVKAELQCQIRNRLNAADSLLTYSEVNTTAMDWERHTQDVVDIARLDGE